ncbi:hypothetical protein HPP92_019146 [Vanilla planifolia]|uniref:Uncharacterized protein n=1 Tax=Vanilla planifolia TaxID=51239 RepID=A0A835QBX9_VANPL|nr:hypothetical protein HPP92_019146 [Vanilla planifolia]
MEHEWMKRRSFRNEDMESRRVFLRSYPLRWEEEEGEEDVGFDRQEEQEQNRKTKRYSKVKFLMKSKLMAVLDWGGGKLMVMRKLKNKVAVYLVACQPFGFKTNAKYLEA